MFDSELFPLKRKLNAKIYTLFENIRLRLKDTAGHTQYDFPEQAVWTSAKLSQGENYNGYPWVVLDFPRMQPGEHSCAWRLMFWYGHYFSLHFVATGNHAREIARRITQNMRKVTESSILFSTHTDPWMHDLGDASFHPLNKLEAEAVYAQVHAHGFIKLSCVTGNTSADVEEKIIAAYRGIGELLL
ncbi:MAG: hypothetical protein R2794_06100 [Chitinophagales bacterium]